MKCVRPTCVTHGFIQIVLPKLLIKWMTILHQTGHELNWRSLNWILTAISEAYIAESTPQFQRIGAWMHTTAPYYYGQHFPIRHFNLSNLLWYLEICSYIWSKTLSVSFIIHVIFFIIFSNIPFRIKVMKQNKFYLPVVSLHHGLQTWAVVWTLLNVLVSLWQP